MGCNLRKLHAGRTRATQTVKQPIGEDTTITNKTSKKPILIAITGGPCAGKSSLEDALRRKYTGCADVIFQWASETATDLHAEGLVFDESYDTQKTILETQAAREYSAIAHASRISYHTGAVPLIVCDRDILDTKAYGDSTVAEALLSEYAGGDTSWLYERYDLVLHMTCVAVDAPELYTCANNPARKEKDPAEAATLDTRLWEAYAPCPNHIRLNNSNTLDRKIEKAIAYIDNIVRCAS